ncbi:fucose-1-phosphate guanylyltransferase [Strongylocentrotus purpuratus]|uniref:GDP-fucose pyrophosphorylase domain-containing protein n=1 Tax=Strongylocentrotus purpuratus TaxID=7668 RepID=A0A7M7NK19_STRPU|nr:fucose-1-phosphate guanylyltransferase [Strongylocentrotus purpuratus]
MAQKRRAIEDLVQRATESKIKKFESIRGKQEINFPYWDIVVITAGDEDQKTAYDLQLQEKLARQQLPLGTKYHVLKDPGNVKIGPGGSMMAALSYLQTIYNQSLFKKKVLFIPAGGYSQRLPSASLLGKIFTAVPYGRPIYQMLELILAMYIDLPAHMPSGGIFLACSDVIILYDCTVGVEWSFDKPGITAFGHPAPIAVGTTHGVFLYKDTPNVCSQVHIVECEEFLHKRSEDVLREKGVLLPQPCQQTLGISEDHVLVDSGYFMDGETAKKMIEFYEEKSPLSCEIDSHGDFLHGLGNCGNNSYINDMSNVSSKTDKLLSMRQEVFKLLQGTPLHVLVLPYSKFYHIGTTEELLSHFCDNCSLRRELSLTKDAFNRSVDLGDSNTVLDKCATREACIMDSIVPQGMDTSKPCIVEYCHFKSPCHLGERCIVSNCVVQAPSSGCPVSIPSFTFLHTAAVKTREGSTLYVTIFFDIRDNLKRSAPHLEEAGQLSFLNQSLQVLFNNFNSTSLQAIFPPGTTTFSIWNAKLFPPKETMEQSFQTTMKFLDEVHTADQEAHSIVGEGCLSMADVLNSKDIQAMLVYRKQLYSLILAD